MITTTDLDAALCGEVSGAAGRPRSRFVPEDFKDGFLQEDGTMTGGLTGRRMALWGGGTAGRSAWEREESAPEERSSP